MWSRIACAKHSEFEIQNKVCFSIYFSVCSCQQTYISSPGCHSKCKRSAEFTTVLFILMKIRLGEIVPFYCSTVWFCFWMQLSSSWAACHGAEVFPISRLCLPEKYRLIRYFTVSLAPGSVIFLHAEFIWLLHSSETEGLLTPSSEGFSLVCDRRLFYEETKNKFLGWLECSWH